MLTDGMRQGRVQINGWLVAEDRNKPYDGSQETTNPLQERTRIRVWLVTADVRLTKQSGCQIALSVPDVTRSAVVTSVTPVAENEFGLRTGASVEVGAGISREMKWHTLIGILRRTTSHDVDHDS